jgi:hypothetical protein
MPTYLPGDYWRDATVTDLILPILYPIDVRGAR